MSDLIRKAMSLGIGITIMGKEKIEQVVDELVSKGEIAPSESKELVTRLIEKGEDQKVEMKRVVKENMLKLLDELHVATKQDIERLERRLDQLEARQSDSQ
jgi:polyhydroxyalkanoate synthesis regulator phasin